MVAHQSLVYLWQASMLVFDTMGLSGVAQRYLTALAFLTSAGNAFTVTVPGHGSFAGTTVSQYLTKRPLPVTVDA